MIQNSLLDFYASKLPHFNNLELFSHYFNDQLQTQSFSATVSPVGGSNRRRSNSSTTKPRPRIVQSTSGPSVSGQMDAIELRDETVKMRKEMNVLRKERDIAKAQQVRSFLRYSQSPAGEELPKIQAKPTSR